MRKRYKKIKQGLFDECELYSHVVKPFPGRNRDNVSPRQRWEEKRGQEEVSELACNTLRTFNGHVDYIKMIIYSIPSQLSHPTCFHTRLFFSSLFNPTFMPIHLPKYLRISLSARVLIFSHIFLNTLQPFIYNSSVHFISLSVYSGVNFFWFIADK